MDLPKDWSDTFKKRAELKRVSKALADVTESTDGGSGGGSSTPTGGGSNTGGGTNTGGSTTGGDNGGGENTDPEG